MPKRFRSFFGRNIPVRMPRAKIVFAVSFSISLVQGCAYFNMLYNARNNFEKAQEMPRAKDGSLSRQQNGLYDEVIKKCEKVIVTYPESRWVDDAILLMGKAFYEKREYDEAIIKFNELEENFPESKLNREGQIYLARSLIEIEDIERAMAILQKFLEKYPEGRYADEALFLLGTSSMKLGDQSGAVASLDRLAREYPRSPFKLKADLEMANILLERGEYNRSLEVYLEVVERNLKDEVMVECLSKLSMIYVKLGRYEDALSVLRKIDAYVVASKNKAAQMLLEGEALVGLDSLSQAIDTYGSILARYPRSAFSAESCYRLGIIYQEKLDSLETAREQFDKVSKQYPNSPFAQEALRRSVNISKLLKYRKSLGKESEERKAEVQFMLGELQLFQFNRPEKALVEYRKVLDDHYESDWAPRAAYAIGYIYGIVLGDTAKARESYEYLLRHFPGSQQAAYASQFLKGKGSSVEGEFE